MTQKKQVLCDLQVFWGLFNCQTPVPDKIQKIRRETDPLAYRIKKKPDFELEDEVQGYIDQVVEILYEPQFQGLTFK